jgi:hypothetical protein
MGSRCRIFFGLFSLLFFLTYNKLRHLELLDIDVRLRSTLRIWGVVAYFFSGFAKGSPHSVLLAFSQSYVEHDLRKNKIVVPFFC